MKELIIYNSMKRQKEVFKPLQAGKVKMYVCGMTVYDYSHLGHARAILTFDMIFRHLKYLGYDVTFVRNFTDIDDKIITRANEQGIDYKELSEKFIEAFHVDTKNLGTQMPTVEPKATEHMNEIITLIESLIEKGVAYEVDGDVFYSVRKFEGYGKLSGKNIEDLEVGARVDVFDVKEDPLDFALWKSAKPDEPSWESPWGQGRPGWHIECSAMSMKHLGESFDIHGGGRDLIFPHHENEIAQSEACTHKEFAKFWIHNGFVNINAEKMSKSLNNFLTIREILETTPAEVIRLFILSSHYRSPIDYTEQNINNAFASLERFYQTKKRVDESLTNDQAKDSALIEKAKKSLEDFDLAMNDDFNTAKVIGATFELVRDVNKTLDAENALSENFKQLFHKYVNTVHQVLNIFGSDAKSYFEDLKNKNLKNKTITPEQIEDLIAQRKQARTDKNWARADEIRDLLLKDNIVLKDNADGVTTWSVVQS